MSLFILFLFLLIDLSKREKGTLICCSTYLYIHWLILICALTGDQTHNLGVLGQHSNQLNHPDRKNHVTILIKFLQQWNDKHKTIKKKKVLQ